MVGRTTRLSRLHSRLAPLFRRVRTRLKPGVLSRPATKIRGAVIHTTESGRGSLVAIVNYLRNTGVQADSHYVVGDIPFSGGFTEVVRLVPEGKKAWTALSANPYFVQYELIGRAARTRKEWLTTYRAQLRTVAALVAEDVIQYGFPVRHAVPGIVGHRDLKRWGFPQTHTDPGTGFPWDVFLADVRYYLGLTAAIKLPKPQPNELAVKRSRRARHAAARRGSVRML